VQRILAYHDTSGLDLHQKPHPFLAQLEERETVTVIQSVSQGPRFDPARGDFLFLVGPAQQKNFLSKKVNTFYFRFSFYLWVRLRVRWIPRFLDLLKSA
jgi:hypothetical protein